MENGIYKLPSPLQSSPITLFSLSQTPSIMSSQPLTTPALADVPKNFGLIIFPGFQALDVFGPIDALNLLSSAGGIPMNLSILATTLDPVSTKTHVPSFQISKFSESIVPTHTFDNPPSDLDVLIVPGGFGTSIPENMEPIITYIRKTYPSLKYILSICTGSGVLARAGVLDGKKATGNKSAWFEVTPFSKKTHWIKKARWVEDGNVWTAAGVSAGIDMTLAWMDTVYGVRDVEDMFSLKGKKELFGEAVGRWMEYKRERDWRGDPFAADYEGEDVLPSE